MRRFLVVAERLSIVIDRCTQLLKQFVFLIIGLRSVVLALAFLVAAMWYLKWMIEALLACPSTAADRNRLAAFQI